VQALVHFVVGVSAALLIFSVVDWPVRREFLATFLSGFWAMIPDGHWLLREGGVDAAVDAWRSFHQTPYANVFWFHHAIDSLETGQPNLEAGVSLAVLLVVVLLYYRYNDWTMKRVED
jgi:hypothetical protein